MLKIILKHGIMQACVGIAFDTIKRNMQKPAIPHKYQRYFDVSAKIGRQSGKTYIQHILSQMEADRKQLLKTHPNSAQMLKESFEVYNRSKS